MQCLLLVVLCGVALVQAAPQGSTPPIPIISSHSEVKDDGGYSYGFQTGNDITVEEEGNIKKAANPENPEEANVIAVQGKYSYKSDDGTVIELTYSSDDETGFVAQGAHLPTSPPIPEAIQKALAFIASQPSTPEPGRAGRR